MNELSERQIKILKVIIRTYMETGEPVGSRTISKASDLNLSSATIRNEMSDLEEMGYILQPHTSAGRIRSDKGYRFYVDQVIREKDSEIKETQELMIKRVDRLELLLKQLAQILAKSTNYTALIGGPGYHQSKLKFIQLSRVEEKKLLVVVVVEGNIIRNSFVTLEEGLSDEEILNMNILLNNSLNGLTIEEINLGIITKLKEQAGSHRKVVDLVLSEVSEAIQAQDEDLQIYTSGATNIFKYPELSDSQRASDLISAFEEKQDLKDLFINSETGEPGTGIQVYIGDESPIRQMRDCSVVTATYELGDGINGTVGIVGPKRMDYKMVMDNLKTLKVQLDEIFNKKDKDE